ncbi:MAG TPA: hypothetical protein PKV33_03055 [Methanothrix sp.]|nr:hypothetical protein [Methanothrix sp.]
MSEFELIAGNPENLSEIGNKTNEFIGSTEICDFEGCRLINNEQLANYLSETIPPSHLEGCPYIEFDPNNPQFTEFPGTLGFYECGSHAIHIAGDGCFPNGAEELKNTVTHEIGHNAYADIVENNPELAAKWEALNRESWQKLNAEGIGFVSDYAMTNKLEDFAESYQAYTRDPEKLQIMNPDKYAFMHDYVFAGREYQPLVLAYWTYDSAGNKVEVTPTGVYDLSGNRIAWSL